jgi:HYR domain
MKQTLLLAGLILLVPLFVVAQCEAVGGEDIYTCLEGDYQVTMGAEMPVDGALGTWSILSEVGTFSICDVHSPKSSISDFSNSTVYTLLWTVQCPGNLMTTDTVEVYVFTPSMAPANAGSDINIATPQSWVQLDATAVMPPQYGQWSLVSGPNIPYFTDINSHNTTVGILTIGTYQFKWSILGSTCYNGAIEDIVQVNVFQAGTLPFFVGAGPDKHLCGSSVNANLGAFPVASPAAGQWSVIAGAGTIFNVNSPSAMVYFMPEGQNTFVWTVNDGLGNIASDTTNIFVDNAGPMDFLGPDFSLCNNIPFIDLSLTVPENGHWSGDCITANGLFAAISTGEYNIHLEYTNLSGNCTSYDDITISNVAPSSALVCNTDSPILVTTDPLLCGAYLEVPTPETAIGCSLISLVNDFNDTDNASGFYPSGTSALIWTAQFESGTATCQQTIIVQDNEPPVVSCGSSILLLADLDLCTSSDVVLVPPIATDNCGILFITNDAPPVFDIGISPVTWIATDIYGNGTTCVQNVTIIDNQPPTLECIESDTIFLSADCSAIVPDYSTFNWASDNCDLAAFTYSQYPSPGAMLNGPQEVTINFTVTDGSGNSAVCSFPLVASGNCTLLYSIEDLTTLLGIFGCIADPECLEYDLNGDGIINVQDLLIMMSFFN